MTAVVMCVAAELRGRWRASLVLAALVGLVGGVAIATLAGARRTSTSFDRMIEAVEGWDVLVNPDLGTETALDLDAVADLPEVAALSRAAGMPVFAPDDEGNPDVDAPFFAVAAMDDSSFIDHHRPLVHDGRLPDPSRADEVLIGPGLARDLDLEAGDEIELLYLSIAQLEEAAGAVDDLPAESVTFTVAGVAVDQASIVVDEAFADESIQLTSAFYAEHSQDAYFLAVLASLRDGANDVAAFRAGVEALVPQEPIEFQTLERIEEVVDRAVRPQVVALTVFGPLTAAAGVLLLAQALTRQLTVDARDTGALAAIGMTGRQRFAIGSMRVFVIAMLGALLSVVVAIGVSGRFPVGPARAAEPSPGIEISHGYVWTGMALIPLILLAAAAVPLWRLSRQRRAAPAARASFVARTLAAAGAGPVPVVGVRMAVRPLLLGVAGVLTGLVGVLTFAAGLSGLLDSPERYGWAWDHLVELTGELPEETQRRALAMFAESDDVEAMTVLWYDRLVIDGQPLPAIGVEPLKGELNPTVVEGRSPARADEIALGSRDLDRLDIGIGDSVVVTSGDGEEISLAVVGQAVYPGLGTYPGADRTELARGAVVTSDTLREFGAGFESRSLAVAYAAGADPDRVANELLGGLDVPPDVGFIILSDQRPGDVVSLERVRNVPLVLAGLLAVLAAAGLAHGLLGSVRRGRRDLAVLTTLGFTRRQVIGAVAWQAAVTAVVALVVALPLGIAVGRTSWTLLADDLGIPPAATTPLLAVAAIVGTTALIGVAVAVLPARRAARLRPAVVLRTE